MGLDMKTRKKLTEETAKRYCTAGKKQKSKIIDEFTATTGYNRKYAIHILKMLLYPHNNPKKTIIRISTSLCFLHLSILKSFTDVSTTCKEF